MSKEISEYIDGFSQNPETRYIERIAAYIRVSTQEQKLHGLSLDAQKMKLEEYAEKHNLKIVGWYMDEGISARKLIRKRPALQQMINDAKKEMFDRIIFIKLDRYFRSVAEYHECQKILNDHNVTWTATEEKYDLTTANGRAFINMKLTIAELEADQGSERIKLVNEYKVKAGLPLYGSQSLPFAFKNLPVPGSKRKSVQKDPDYIDLADDLIQHFMKYQSKRKTMIYINNKYGTDIRYNSLTHFLESTLLCGEYRGNPTFCKGFVDRDTFDKIQDILENNVRKSGCRNGEKRDYIFSGLLRCPSCNKAMSGTIQHCVSSNGTRYKYKFYRCQSTCRDGKCEFKKRLSENVVQRAMLKNIGKYLENAKAKILNISSGEESVPEHNLEELMAELERLNYAWKKGRIKSVDQYDKDYDDLMVKIEAATAERIESPEENFDVAEACLEGDWKEIYEQLDDQHRQAFWRSFINQIVIDTDKHITSVKFF